MRALTTGIASCYCASERERWVLTPQPVDPPRAPPCPAAGTYTETSQGEIRFPEISTKTLEKTIQYFYYKLKYTNSKDGPPPEFKIDPEHALELLMAANYLDA